MRYKIQFKGKTLWGAKENDVFVVWLSESGVKAADFKDKMFEANGRKYLCKDFKDPYPVKHKNHGLTAELRV